MQKREALMLWKQLGFPGEPNPVGEGLYGYVVEVSPEMAQQILDNFNTGNRTKKRRAISRYVRDMEQGRWQLTHEGVGFATIAKLLDGQNRLEAIVQSGITVKMLVVIGLPEESALCIDEGQNRSALDVSIIGNFPTTQARLCVVKNLHRGYANLTNSVSNPEALDLLKKYEDILDWLELNIPRVTGITTSAAAMGAIGRCYMAIRGNNRKVGQLKKFCQVLDDGQWKELGENGIYQNAARFRDRMMEHKARYWGALRPLYTLMEYVLYKTIEEPKVLNRLPSDETLKNWATEWFPLAHDEAEAEAVAV